MAKPTLVVKFSQEAERRSKESIGERTSSPKKDIFCLAASKVAFKNACFLSVSVSLLTAIPSFLA